MGNLQVITEETGFDFNSAFNAVYKKLNQTGDLAIEVVFVPKDEIKRLNAHFRNKEAVTDVLSFPSFEGVRYKNIDGKEYELFKDDGRILIGSVAICLERAKEQAEEYGHSLEREVLYLATHGALHCFGYDHVESKDEEEMTSLCESIMQEIKVLR